MKQTKQIIGITGGIGSGKSVVANILISMGYPVYNSDARAKLLINSEPDLVQNIKNTFGDVYNSEGLDRRKLANVVFNQPEKLAVLNSLVHPAVGKDFSSWVSKQQNPIVFKEAAILFETGIYKSLNKIILVTCPLNKRIERVMQRDGVSKIEVENRMKNQWEDEKKMKLTDFIIYNSGEELLIPQIEKVIQKLKE